MGDDPRLHVGLDIITTPPHSLNSEHTVNCFQLLAQLTNHHVDHLRVGRIMVVGVPLLALMFDNPMEPGLLDLTIFQERNQKSGLKLRKPECLTAEEL